jgi:hypothetical protein
LHILAKILVLPAEESQDYVAVIKSTINDETNAYCDDKSPKPNRQAVVIELHRDRGQKNLGETPMRSAFLAFAAIAVVITATPTLALARHHPTPAFASARQNQPAATQNLPTPSYDTCGALSIERGVPPGEGNSGNPEAQHKAFIRQCLAGEIPLRK